MLHSLVDPGFPGAGRCRGALAAAYGSHGAAAMQTLTILARLLRPCRRFWFCLAAGRRWLCPLGGRSAGGDQAACLMPHTFTRIRYWPDPAMRIRDPLPHRRTRHLTDFRRGCQGTERSVPAGAPHVRGRSLQTPVRHCPQHPVGNSVGIPGHLSVLI